MHASWLKNPVQRFFVLLTEQTRFAAVLIYAQSSSAPRIDEYLAAHNDEPKPFKWTKNADEILESIARFATRALSAHRGP